MDDAFLARDPPNKEHDRPARVDPVALDGVDGVDRPIELRVDAVVDHVHPLGRHGRDAQNIVPGAFGHRDDPVGHAERRLLQPAGQVVPTPQLLALPGSKRLE